MAHATPYQPSRESELSDPVERLFTRDNYDVGYEVPFGLKRIDLFFWRRKGCPEIVAVELKLTNWRRAVWQAVHNRQVATKSYIALPVRSIRAVDAGILRSLGLGLIGVENDDATIFLQAKRSQVFNTMMADRILRQIR
jgi:hypothetical protein